jgi:hypothetical protein
LNKSKVISGARVINTGNYKSKLFGLVTLVDVAETADYVRLVLSMTDVDSLDLKAKKKEQREKRSISVNTGDDEYGK